jgi:hypothetical protein
VFVKDCKGFLVMSISAVIGTRSQENLHPKNGIKSPIDRLTRASWLNFDNFQLSMNAPKRRIKPV